MSLASAFARFIRAFLVAVVTAGAAFGLLVVFHPFDPTMPAKAGVATTSSEARALEGRIEALRLALRTTEDHRATIDALSPTAEPSDSAAVRAQYEAQIAAASERRDLALRHAKAIRDALTTGVPVSSFAEIRDSVVIGQLLSQQAALDAQIALEGARLRANHPTMRALTAQRASLARQIQQEAASIASALEAEARLDDAQIALLQSQLPAQTVEAAPRDTSALDTTLATQRAELDSLVDAYFNIPPATTTSVAAPSANPLGLPNLLVVAVAGFAAIIFQIALALRRRKPSNREADIAAWRSDADPEIVAVQDIEPLRKAS
jgi:uncharacterized protein involved in exopolysaccharide biosynthesis